MLFLAATPRPPYIRVRFRWHKCAGIATEEIEQFTSKAQSGDYDNVLTTVQEWVSVT